MNKLSLLALLLFSTWARGNEFLPDSLSQNNIEFERCNNYTLRYGFVIKVAEIGWYAPKCDENSILETKNKILRFHYFKDVKADFFNQSAEEYFILNLKTKAQQKALIEPLKNFNNGYTDIQSGQFFQLVHVDGVKLSLYRNEHLLASTDNVELAKKYFNIWFGETPVIEKLKNEFK